MSGEPIGEVAALLGVRTSTLRVWEAPCLTAAACPHIDRLREVSAAASRAFSLLPARPEEVAPPPPARGEAVARRLRTDPDTVERDLVRLVLTIVELLRQLMER